MGQRAMFRRVLRYLFALAMLFSICSCLPVIRAEAADDISWDMFADHSGEPGMYCYTVSGRVSNPIEPSSYNQKHDLIDSLYFDFFLVGQNGTGDARTYRANFSHNGSTQQKYPNFVREQFVSSGAKNFSFDVWLPGQLTRLDMFLNLNGYLGWFSYEKLEFEINSIVCSGIPVNTNPHKDYVSSTTGDSSGHIGARMAPIGGDMLMELLGEDHVTLRQYNEMIQTGSFSGQTLKDSYGAVLETATLENLTKLCDGAINQSFSHADEASWYYYTLNLEVYNPINVSSADADVLNTFYFDFDYQDNNGFGNSQTYRLDMSWSGARSQNLNDRYANLFRATNDNGYDTQIGVWVPGIVSAVRIKLNMDDGERLGVTVHSVNLGGCRISEQSDYVSSAYYDSDAVIPCFVPNTQINLDPYTDEEAAVILKQIRLDRRMNLQDQYGSYITDILWNQAHEEIRAYFDTFTDRATPLQLTRSSKYIMRNAMHRTVYHAQTNEIVQEYMAGRKAAVEGAAEIAQRLMEEAGEYIPPMALPDKWAYTAPQSGTLVFSGFPKDAQIYRKLVQSNGAKAVYVHLMPEQLEKYSFVRSGFTDEFYISVPDTFSVAGLQKEQGTENLNGITPQVLNDATGALETEKYYKTNADGTIKYNSKGVPQNDNSKKPKQITYQYRVVFPETGINYLCAAAALPENGTPDAACGTVRFENLPDGTTAYRILEAGGETYYIAYTAGDLMQYTLTHAAEIGGAEVSSDVLYLSIPEHHDLLDADKKPASAELVFGEHYYTYQNGKLKNNRSQPDETYEYNYCIRLDSTGNRTFTATAPIAARTDTASRYLTERRTVLHSGYDIRFVSFNADDPPLVYTNGTGSDAMLYIFYPDTAEYAVYDDSSKPVGFKSIEKGVYTALGVDIRRYTGYGIRFSRLEESLPTNRLYVVRVGE